jgi:hypothetical protein
VTLLSVCKAFTGTTTALGAALTTNGPVSYDASLVATVVGHCLPWASARCFCAAHGVEAAWSTRPCSKRDEQAVSAEWEAGIESMIR